MTVTRRRGARVGTALTLSAGAAAAGGLWYRRYTTPFPYAHRWMLDKELPYLTRARLLEILAPVAGERMAEIGPGTGLFSLPVAERLAPGGLLDVVDIQPAMLDHTLRCARETGVTSVRATCADARRLPFPGAIFDAVFMVTALGRSPTGMRSCRRSGACSCPAAGS